METTKSFLGRGWSFPPRFSSTGIEMVEAEEDIMESIRIILLTSPGERVLNPQFGCDLKSQTFAKLNTGTISSLQDKIRRSLLFFEPRIQVEEIHIFPSDEKQGGVRIEIQYLVRATNNRANVVFPFYLNEGTDIEL